MTDQSKLSAAMQERLDKWRNKKLPIESQHIFQMPIRNYVPRRGDYGDDIRDFEAKQKAIWLKENDHQI